jgi:hypothetical protein
MSYQLLSRTEPKARKEYRCIWCPEKILKGEAHVHEVSKFDGELQDHRWHPECLAACGSDDDSFCPHECKRGSTEEWKACPG